MHDLDPELTVGSCEVHPARNYTIQSRWQKPEPRRLAQHKSRSGVNDGRALWPSDEVTMCIVAWMTNETVGCQQQHPRYRWLSIFISASLH